MGRTFSNDTSAPGRRREDLTRATRPEVLFVSGHLPYPPVSGGRRREFELLDRLSDRFAFHLMVSSKTLEEDRTNAERLAPLCETVRIFPAGTGQPPGQEHVPELVRGAWSVDLAGAVEEALRRGRVDVVHVERFHLLTHVPEPCPAPILLVEQNIEFSLWGQRLAHALGRRERRRRFTEYVTTVQAEIDAWRRASMCGAVTEDDRATMLAAVPEMDVRIIPHGIGAIGPPPSPGEVAAIRGSAPALLVFVANFAYGPNVDGALWLCRDIFPKVRALVPGIRLVLAGNDPPPNVRALAGPEVEVTGRVPSVEPYLEAADVFLCPLREGGGVKAKLLEALSRGRPVVTTSVGAQGLGPDAERALRIEDRSRGFARAVADLLGDPAERRRLGRSGQDLVASLPTWDDSAEALAGCYRELQRRRAAV
jgi:polysaccharide biosynthesis protein PslH